MTFALGDRVYHFLDETDTGTVIDVMGDDRIRIEFDREGKQFDHIQWSANQIRHVKNKVHDRMTHKARTQELVL